MIENTGLLLEGGGMRSAYTAGVLDLFLDKCIEFPVVATASSGALIGSSYITKQRTRNYKILEEVTNHKDAVSIKNWIRNKEIFGMDYIFDKIPREIVPLDLVAFLNSPTKFIIGTTNIHTGDPVYFDKYQSQEELFTITRASCSLPVLAPSITYNNMELMDGGVSDPIPIRPLVKQGMKKHIVVLTRNRGYIKKATKLNWFFKRIFKDKPELIKILRDRHQIYNDTMKQIYEMEKTNEVFIIQPEQPLTATRFDNNKEKLKNLYLQGYTEAESKYSQLELFLEAKDNIKPFVSGNVPS
ncbi:patatin-like phospholipase family protein [Oceanobacillus halophilus]|uniref:Patatin family protein n=1 Tax=Oceanobacillus halophilus TaxID=930130 RepID=A0A494ZT47_9BACI|nr:patatin family protein [Oceanobacillus halophilus]RKQ29071.1 patatin family protein [Oceanobacillus halophilus]